MPTTRRTIHIFKIKDDNLTNDKVVDDVRTVCQGVLTDTIKNRGWSATIDKKSVEPQNVAGVTGYMVKVNLVCITHRTRREDAVDKDLDFIADQTKKIAGRRGWQLAKKNEVDIPFSTAPNVAINTGKATTYCEFNKPDDWRENFTHVFEREPQIEIIMSAVDAGIYSEFDDRLHCALIGPPAAGKSELLRCVRETFGEEAVMEFDATATTQAGAIRALAQREITPRILLVEEIEKVEEAALRWLLGVMDFRAEINKVNFKSQIKKEVKMLCLATVNNFKLFKGMMSGALASRFVHHIMCPAPSKVLLEKILTRDVIKLKDGNPEWIAPTLEYAEKKGITDPRAALAILKCGRERLLTGEYQAFLEFTSVAGFDG